MKSIFSSPFSALKDIWKWKKKRFKLRERNIILKIPKLILPERGMKGVEKKNKKFFFTLMHELATNVDQQQNHWSESHMEIYESLSSSHAAIANVIRFIKNVFPFHLNWKIWHLPNEGDFVEIYDSSYPFLVLTCSLSVEP